MNRTLDLQEGFYLENWLVEPALGRLSRNGASVPIEPKIMEVLVLLAENQAKVVRRETFLETVWADANVVNHVLARAISELRRAFKDNPQNPRFIQTIPKIGYRLLVPVSRADSAEIDFEVKNFPPSSAAPTATARTVSPKLSYFFAGLATALLFLTALVFFIVARHQSGGFHPH